VDGIPETTPDGTGQLDNLNLDQLGSIQVIRGASSSLYGNASGGAILLNSKRITSDFLTYQAMFGSYGFYSQALSGGIKNEKATYQANVRAFGSDGYREHSAFSQVNARFATHQQFSDKISAVFLAEYVDSPKAQDAGGLTLEATDMDFRQARDRNLTFNAGESITQWKVGTSMKWELSESSRLNSYLFYNQRNFDGRLPFENSGTIKLERDYIGFGNSLDVAKGIHRIKLGYDLLNQSDDRQRFNNLNGTQGALMLSQKESFLNAGFFVLDYIEWQDWVVTAGLRFDINQLEVEDRLLTDGNDSGSINMNNWSYQLGVGRRIFSNMQLFANPVSYTHLTLPTNREV